MYKHDTEIRVSLALASIKGGEEPLASKEIEVVAESSSHCSFLDCTFESSWCFSAVRTLG
jgi:hypothetical protein